MYKVYILYSKIRNRYYVGFTGDDIDERIRKHNSNHSGFTGSANDWKLVLLEEGYAQSDAIAREREIKDWKSRKKIEQLISEKNNPK